MKIITLICQLLCVSFVIAQLDKRIADYLLQNLQSELKRISPSKVVPQTNEIESNKLDSENQLGYPETEDEDLLFRRANGQTTQRTTDTPRANMRSINEAAASTKAGRTANRVASDTSQKAQQNVKQTQSAYIKVGNTYTEVNSAVIINIDLRLKKSADAPRLIVTPPAPYVGSATTKSY